MLILHCFRGFGFKNIFLHLLCDTDSVLYNCSEGFYRENCSNVCIPNCYTWMQHKSKGVSKFKDFLILFSTFDGFIASVAVLIISAIKYNRM